MWSRSKKWAEQQIVFAEKSEKVGYKNGTK
jgi:hypothetical protein